MRAMEVEETMEEKEVDLDDNNSLEDTKVIEVDMDTFRKNGEIRILVGVVDHKNIPAMAKLTTKKLMIYYIYFQVEQVVEEGWLRPEEEYIQDFDEMEDTLSQEMGGREAKRQRNDTTEEKDKEPHIQASEKTRKALEEREEEMKKQNALDVAALAKKKIGDGLLATSSQLPNTGVERTNEAAMLVGGEKSVGKAQNVEETGDNGVNYDLDMKESENLEGADKVDFSGDEGDRAGESDSSVSINTKIINVQARKSPNNGKKKQKSVGILEEIEEANGNRFSNRLAPMSDIPIMDGAKNRAMMKNLQSSEGTSLPTIASTSDYCILDIASKVGIDLGTTLDMIDSNLTLLRGK
ncbi:hypothetical protein ACQ4PT_056780 [Festuca glaucescens]